MKEQLIAALEAERKRMQDNGHSIIDHDYAIHYLRTGEIKTTNLNYEILDACINDYDMMVSDYC